MPQQEDRNGGQPALPERYEALGTLGRGGMGVVYRVRDTTSGRELALKRLLTREAGASNERVIRLFEQEYQALSHLAHPRIVRALDYGRHEDGAYYTMEFLDGGDLRELSPMPWRRVCALLRDVCSALSLLHSRRLVHRDLTPRNVRCTADGKAKLIDLGAITQAGPCRGVVGTPAYLAPEALNSQYVDARTDLFALGATAYFALTGHNAYRAARISGLHDAWRSPPAPPSRHTPDVPPELDDLVMSMLHLQALARPASAAEVMERLSAIADLSLDEQLVVQKAYLSTPMLAGREQALGRVRKHLLRASRKRATPLLVSGASGVGRSRFLDACALEAKLLGAHVLRADAGDGAAGDWGCARALLRQLFDLEPEATRRAARAEAELLTQVLVELPELLGDAGGEEAGDGSAQADAPITFASPQEERARIGAAIQRVILEVLRSHFVLLAVDDIDGVDGPSMAVLGWMVDAPEAERWAIAATARSTATGETAPPHAWLMRSAASILLEPLRAGETLEVLTSVFGDIPNVRSLAKQLHAISLGNPRALMYLAQHLVDRELVRYEAGHWRIPERIEAGELPRALADALDMTLDELSAAALEFAQALALSELARVSLDECQVLMGTCANGTTPDTHDAHDAHDKRDAAEATRAIDELVWADVLRMDEDGYALRHPGWAQALLKRLPQATAQRLHLRVAEVQRGRPRGHFRVVQHLLLGDRPQAAVEALVELTRAYEEEEKANTMSAYEYALGLPRGWDTTFRAVIDASAALGRPSRERFDLRWHLVSFAALAAVTPREEIALVTQQLEHDCGLDIYAQLDPALPESERLGRALTEAQARHDQTPELERAWSPGEAIPALARTLLHVMGIAGRGYDYEMLDTTPSMLPLVALSPALASIEESRTTTLNLLGGRVAEARTRLASRVEQLSAPSIEGLDSRIHQIMRDAAQWMLGTLEAQAGIEGAERWADAIEHSPMYEVSAWRMRAHCALRRGDMALAEQHKQHLELLRMRNKPPQIHEGTELFTEMLSYAETDDLIRVKESLPAIEAVAATQPAWRPVFAVAQGHYQRLRGNHAQALEHFEQALELLTPGRHVAWPAASGARVLALITLERYADAKREALAAYAMFERERLGGLEVHVRSPLALALAHAGDLEAAREHADAVIEMQRDTGVRGIAVGIAHETRARIALLMQDEGSFYMHAGRCAEEYRTGHNPVLTAKYERLVREARRHGIGVSETLASAAAIEESSARTDLSELLATALGECRSSRERAQRVLELLLVEMASESGHLYLALESGLSLVAQRGSAVSSPAFDSMVSEYVQRQLSDGVTQTATLVQDGDVSASPLTFIDGQGKRLVPMMLAHPGSSGLTLVGVALIAVPEGVRFTVPHGFLQAMSISIAASGDAVAARAS